MNLGERPEHSPSVIAPTPRVWGAARSHHHNSTASLPLRPPRHVPVLRPLCHSTHKNSGMATLSFTTFGLTLALAAVRVAALDNGLALTPPMGWSSRAQHGCAVTEDAILDAARALVDTGLKDLGYECECYPFVDARGWSVAEVRCVRYAGRATLTLVSLLDVLVDDCKCCAHAPLKRCCFVLTLTLVLCLAGWQADGRDSKSGAPAAHPTRFPSGIKALADQVHGMGLKVRCQSRGLLRNLADGYCSLALRAVLERKSQPYPPRR